MYKIGGAHLQCVANYYTKFEQKGMKTFGVTYYTKVLGTDGWSGPTTRPAFAKNQNLCIV